MDNPSESPVFFVDTNVFVDHILLKGILTRIKKEEFPLYDGLKPSSDFIKTYLKNYNKIILRTSFINICEMPSALIEDLVKEHMYFRRIPFNYSKKYERVFLKNKSFRKQIEEAINKHYKFFEEEKIWHIHKLEISEEREFKEIDQLRIDFHLPFADSLIFFIAKKEGGFFVTSDSHHFLSNKKLKEEYEPEIKIIPPNKALEIMNEYLKRLNDKEDPEGDE